METKYWLLLHIFCQVLAVFIGYRYGKKIGIFKTKLHFLMRDVLHAKKYMRFEDLLFRPHPGGGVGIQGMAFFPNGYGVSVVRFKTMFGSFGSYTDNELEWEIAILKGTKENWEICYSTPITDDVIGHLTQDEVTDKMFEIQNLK